MNYRIGSFIDDTMLNFLMIAVIQYLLLSLCNQAKKCQNLIFYRFCDFNGGRPITMKEFCILSIGVFIIKMLNKTLFNGRSE